MKPFSLLSRAVHLALTGPPGLPAAFDFPLTSPQKEVTVWLHGHGEPLDVTTAHSVACPIPFTLCINLEDAHEADLSRRRLSLRFVDRTEDKRLLGEIRLQHQQAAVEEASHLHLFRAVGCRNYCFSPLRDWTRSLYAGWKWWKAKKTGRLQVSALDSRCNEVIFSCPRPTVLVSLRRDCHSNLFPMNLMAQVSPKLFVFALNSNNLAAASVKAIRELAVCTIPFTEAERVRQLGKNHYRNVDGWDRFDLLAASLSPTLQIPIPDFALTSTELRVQNELVLGSHIFFVAEIVGKQVHRSAPEFYRIHGTYANDRQKRDKVPAGRSDERALRLAQRTASQKR